MSNTMSARLGTCDARSIAARIEAPTGHVFEVSTRSNVTLDHSLTPWLPPTLAAGMRHGWNVSLDGPVDATALNGAELAQDVFAGWYPRSMGRISVSAADDPIEPGRAPGVGCFFSGGVDSFYSAITQSERITHLIFVHGFDIPIGHRDLARRALDGAREAAADLGKPLIEVETTVRPAFGDPLSMDWGPIFHGPSLAHVGLALSEHVQTVIIPSSYSQEQLHPWGSHPDLDRRWSSSAVSFEHHELTVGRFGKIRRISSSDTAMNHLRVCWLNTDGAFNCGECAKCVRTKIGLKVAGVESPKLPGPIDPRTVRRMLVTSAERPFLREALAEMREAGTEDVELERAVKSAVRRGYFRQFVPSLH